MDCRCYGGADKRTSILLPIDGNSYGDYTAFLPGAVSLGDILKNEGYKRTSDG